MPRARALAGSILCVAFCGCITAAFASPWFQGGPPSSVPARAELAHADLLSRKDWKSTEVQVAGLYLGMSRSEANAAALKNGFTLNQYTPPAYVWVPCSDSSECFLATSGKYDNVSIHLGKKGEIVQIDLEVAAYPGKILRGLKGQSYQFFHGSYTDALRLNLFGPETSWELVDGGYSPAAKSTRYTYADRGITVTASLNPVTALRGLETLSLVPPAATAR